LVESGLSETEEKKREKEGEGDNCIEAHSWFNIYVRSFKKEKKKKITSARSGTLIRSLRYSF